MKGLTKVSVLLMCCLTMAGPGYAQQYPDHPVRIVVPFAAGGATDVAARLLAEELKKQLGQQVIVENRPGASGAIGIDAVAKAKPDGYTLGMSGVGPTAILPFIDPKLPYSPASHLDIVGRVNAVGLILCARDDFPAGTVGEMLDYARKNPGRVTYGSVGAASPNHIVHEELARLAGAKMLHVPYSGESPIVTALLSRDIDIAYVTVAVATNFINSGKFKALAAGGPERSANFPNLATVGEQIKTKDYSAYTWTVLVTAKGTPPAILERLNVALNEILGDPQVKERMEKLGLATLGGDVRAAQEFISRELSRYEIMIRDNNIKRE